MCVDDELRFVNYYLFVKTVWLLNKTEYIHEMKRKNEMKWKTNIKMKPYRPNQHPFHTLNWVRQLVLTKSEASDSDSETKENWAFYLTLDRFRSKIVREWDFRKIYYYPHSTLHTYLDNKKAFHLLFFSVNSWAIWIHQLFNKNCLWNSTIITMRSYCDQ